MTKQEMISYCLSYPDCYEDYPFDEEWAVMRHRGNRKSFAFVYERGGHPCVNLKCEPMCADFLRSAFVGVIPAYHMSKVHWNTVMLDSAVPQDELQKMVRQSYELTKPKRKKRSNSLWVLETPRLGFRQMTEEDLAALRPILGDVQTMYAWEYGFTDAQIAEWIKRANLRYQTCGYAHYAAVQKESGELIGLMGILPEEIDGKTYFGLGYIVARNFWGQGYAIEGASAWLQYAFKNLGAQQVIADIRPENTALCRVAERLGLTVIGEHIKYHNGKEMPHLIYSKNREE